MKLPVSILLLGFAFTFNNTCKSTSRSQAIQPKPKVTPMTNQLVLGGPYIVVLKPATA